MLLGAAMASGERSISSARGWPSTAIVILLLPQLVGLLGLFPLYAFTAGDIGLRIFAVGVALSALFTLLGLWLRKSWALWAALVVVSLNVTIDLFAWATNYDRLATSFSILLLVAVVLLAFRQGQAPSRRISLHQRGLFAFVLAF